VRSILALLGAAVGLGGVSVLAKLGYQAGAHPVDLFAARMTLAALLLAPAGAAAASGLGWRLLALGGMGGAAFAGTAMAEFEALSRAPAATVVLLLFVAPVWVALGSWLLWHSAPGWRRSGLVLVVLAGTALLVASPAGAPADPTALGLALGASVLSAAFFLCMARLREELAAPAAAALLLVAAALWAAPLTAGSLAGSFDRPPVAACAVAIAALTAGSLVALCAGLGQVSALSGSAIAGVEPAVVALLSWVVLEEELSPLQLGGAAVMLAGVLGLAGLTRAAPAVEPNGADEDRADHHVLPKTFHSRDQQPIREHHGDEYADHGS
jgi:drug/metabolite transporter (DMT)-like permease